MRWGALSLIALVGCQNSPVEKMTHLIGHSRASASAVARDRAPREDTSVASYEGVDPRGIPHYATGVSLSPGDASILRRAYGVEDSRRLYVSDSTDEGLLKYDTRVKQCPTCYVNSYRIGFVSVRRPGESWEQAERRVRGTGREFAAGSRSGSRSIDDLDPDAAPIFSGMLHDAKRAGFRFRISATYRSPVREAYLFAKGGGQTHTLTSNHSYGRAVDVVIDDGNLGHAPTRRDWIAFRHWVSRYRIPGGLTFRILGKADRTWDWPHVELPSSEIGFRSIDEAVRRGRACLAARSRIPCNFPMHLPGSMAGTVIQ